MCSCDACAVHIGLYTLGTPFICVSPLPLDTLCAALCTPCALYTLYTCVPCTLRALCSLYHLSTLYTLCLLCTLCEPLS